MRASGTGRHSTRSIWRNNIQKVDLVNPDPQDSKFIKLIFSNDILTRKRDEITAAWTAVINAMKECVYVDNSPLYPGLEIRHLDSVKERWRKLKKLIVDLGDMGRHESQTGNPFQGPLAETLFQMYEDIVRNEADDEENARLTAQQRQQKERLEKAGEDVRLAGVQTLRRGQVCAMHNSQFCPVPVSY